MPLVNPELTKSQNWLKSSKTTFFMFLHQRRATRRFLSTLTKFDLELTFGGTRNPNFFICTLEQVLASVIENFM